MQAGVTHPNCGPLNGVLMLGISFGLVGCSLTFGSETCARAKALETVSIFGMFDGPCTQAKQCARQPVCYSRQLELRR